MEEYTLKPLEFIKLEKHTECNLLPEKSKKLYDQAYRKFMNYCNEKNINSFSENVLLVYFTELTKNMKSPTLWSLYSMLKSTLNAYNDIDIGKYTKLRSYLKRQADGYCAKKSRVLEKEQIHKFLMEAPDNIYLSTKVAMIFGVFGACRCDELLHMKLVDIEDMGDKLLIILPTTKTNKRRSFIVSEYLDIYRKYSAARPAQIDSDRFFFKYSNGKASNQLIGIHKFGKMPEQVATFLKLKKPDEYTGHCFRRTSAKLLINSEVDITTLKMHGGWKSSVVSEGYMEESVTCKPDISEDVFSTASTSSTG